MDTSRFNEHSRQRAILNSASRNYLQQIQVPRLGCVHNHVTSPRKRIFAIVSRPTRSQVKGKTIRRILIFDNHPDTLRLILDSGIDPDSGDAASLPSAKPGYSRWWPLLEGALSIRADRSKHRRAQFMGTQTREEIARLSPDQGRDQRPAISRLARERRDRSRRCRAPRDSAASGR